jgi:transposase
MKDLAARKEKNTVQSYVLYMALELSESKWRIAFSNGSKNRQVTIQAGSLIELSQAIQKAKEKLRLPSDAPVISCYEAGRDGFWVHRFLTESGILNHVVDSASIEVNRRARRAKTDRLDAEKLLMQLIRYIGGEKNVWSVAHVPNESEEDARRLHRERKALTKERTRHNSRIKSLLALQGIRYKNKGRQSWNDYIEKLHNWDGKSFPQHLKEELLREIDRLSLVEKQLVEIETKMLESLQNKEEPVIQQVLQLLSLKAVGLIGAWELVMEWFSWRNFKNRREVGALAGLTGTPYDSGNSQREQGITKAGNRRIRDLMIQLAWLWVRYQPNSQLTLWFKERFAQSKRFRKIGIVALARKLLIALWRCATQGIVPVGAVLKTATAK